MIAEHIIALVILAFLLGYYLADLGAARRPPKRRASSPAPRRAQETRKPW